MIIDVHINVIDEGTPIVVKDKSEDMHLIGIELGLGAAQLLMSLKNATELSKKLRTEIARQKAMIVGEGAKRMLAKRDWVERILVRPFEDQVGLRIETHDKEDLALMREAVTIGMILGRAAECVVSAHAGGVGLGLGEDEIVIYEREQPQDSAPKEELGAAASC